jgi:hypothetical protein
MFIPLVNILGMYAALLCVLLCGKPWHLPSPSQYLTLVWRSVRYQHKARKNSLLNPLILQPPGESFDETLGLGPIGNFGHNTGQLATLAAHHAADQRGQSIEVSGHLTAGIRPDSIVSRPDVWHDSVKGYHSSYAPPDSVSMALRWCIR